MTSPELIPGPAYRIVISHLVIRCPNPSDSSAMDLAIRQNIGPQQPWLLRAKDEPAGIEQRITFLRRTRGDFDLGTDFGYLVFDPTETMLLGGTCLSTRLGMGAREIGYWINTDQINQGHTTEAAAALTKVAFEIDHVSRVEIQSNPRNTRSASIPRKLGFIHEATLHDRDLDIDGALRDTMVWTLFEADYPASSASKPEIHACDTIGRCIL